MLFTKVEAISNSLCKGLGILLCCTLAKIRLLYIARTFSRSPFSKKHFIYLKLFLNSSEVIWQGKLTGKKRGEEGEGGQFAGENSACITFINTKPSKIQPASLLQTQNLRQKNVTEFLVVSDCVFYYLNIIQQSNS